MDRWTEYLLDNIVQYKQKKSINAGTIYMSKNKPAEDGLVSADTELFSASQFNITVDVGCIIMASNNCGRV